MNEITDRYPAEVLDANEEDDGTMPANLAELGASVIGHRIVSARREQREGDWYGGLVDALEITLDNGTRVWLAGTSDCCAYTELESFLLNASNIDHAITGVGTTDGFTKWHIFADLGDVLELKVGWSCGNAFYYGYGFEITVEEVSA